MKPTITNSVESNSAAKSKSTLALLLLFVLATSGISVTNAQNARQNDVKVSTDQAVISERNPGNGTQTGNSIVAPVSPTITGLTMLDLGHDKAILTWASTANFDSILFRYGPSGSSATRMAGISGNPNPERYFLMGLSALTTYDIEVSTVNNRTRSAWSSPITITTLPPPAPRLANQSNSNMLVINPNPATVATTISFMVSSNAPQQVTIISSAGRVMFSRQLIPNADKVQFNVDLSTYTPGVYTVRVNNNMNISVERFIKL